MAIRDYKKFFVFGMARSGRAVSLLLAERGYDVAVFDDESDAVAEFIDSNDVRSSPACARRISAVGGASWGRSLDESDCLVLSPGVPLDHAVVSRAERRKIRVVGEVEVAYQFNSGKVIGVTGTNGKSTVVGVIGGILDRAGVDVVVAGNVGKPFSDAIRSGNYETIVLELSSFQLDTIDGFRADIAVLLNVTPDHLDRYHNSFDEYASSKTRILNRTDRDAVYVYNADDETAVGLCGDFAGETVAYSSKRRVRPGVFVENGVITRDWGGRTDSVLERGEFTPVGVHNLENAMAAVAAVTPMGIDLADIREALREYRPLPHRMELVRVTGGIAYVNDSKATNVDAAMKSLVSVEGNVVIILGGRDKDGDFSTLVPYLSRVRLAVLIGEAKGAIRAALGGHCEVVDASDMKDAVARATRAARVGDTVLLAPACASFDMFDDYEDRGKAFREEVNLL